MLLPHEDCCVDHLHKLENTQIKGQLQQRNWPFDTPGKAQADISLPLNSSHGELPLGHIRCGEEEERTLFHIHSCAPSFHVVSTPAYQCHEPQAPLCALRGATWVAESVMVGQVAISPLAIWHYFSSRENVIHQFMT